MSKNKSYRYSFRNQPAIQTLGLITSQQMRDPKSHEILKVFQSVNLFCQDLQCYFLLNLYSNSQPWLAAASASSVPSSLGVEEKTQQVTQTWVWKFTLLLAGSKTIPLAACQLTHKTKRKSPIPLGCCEDSWEQVMNRVWFSKTIVQIWK